jgi:hypothetical protein
MSWGQALKNVLSSALDAVIDFFVKWGLKSAETWLADQFLAKATNVSQATGAAAVYAVNAASSVAAIPITGWAMAPGVMASAYGAGLSMAGLASAAGGWGEVPSDQIAQIHKKEMVLPAQLAEGIRSMVTSGVSGKQGDTFVVQANDAKSFMDMYKRSAPSVLRLHKEMIRNGRTS